jgi:DNA-binding transcriptional ArsR family regulator
VEDDLATRAASVGALADPARRALYDYVAGESGSVSREEAANAVGLPLHSAKFHLDRLVERGLLEVEFRRLSGRKGPGAVSVPDLCVVKPARVWLPKPARPAESAGW